MKEHGHGQVEAWVDLDSLDEPKLMAQYFRNFDLDFVLLISTHFS